MDSKTGRSVEPEKDYYEVGDKITFECAYGFSLKFEEGQSVDDDIVCTEDGSWSRPIPECEGAYFITVRQLYFNLNI